MENLNDKDWNVDRKFANLQESTWTQLDEIKVQMGFKSINQTVEYLLDLENSVKKQDMIRDKYLCTSCGKEVDLNPKIAERLHRYKHFQCDMTTDCQGKLRHGYGVMIKIETKPELTDTTDMGTEMTEEDFKKYVKKDENGTYTFG